MTRHVDHDVAALYVMDALAPDEAREFEDHLAGCDECQREVVEMRSVTERLSRSVEVDPPPSLRSALLAEIATTDQEPVEPVQAPASAPPEAGRLAEVVPFRSRRARRVALLVAAAAVVLAAGFGVWGLQNRHDAQQANDQVAQLVNLLGASDVQTVSGHVAGGGSG